MDILIGLFIFAWFIITYIQLFLALGTAYRSTKAGGDSGVALFGWLIVYGLAAYVPGLGFYLWKVSRDDEDANANQNKLANSNEPINAQITGSSENWTYNTHTQQAERQPSTSLNDGAFQNPTDNERQG